MIGSKKTTIAAVCVAITVFALGYFLSDKYSIQGNRIVKVKLGDTFFKAEAVSSGDKLAKGLGGRKELCESCAMLFEFQNSGKHAFWMKGMEIAIDIIWISGRRIVHVEKNIQSDFSGTLTPVSDADAVLEINAGKFNEMGLEVGDMVEL